jgi:Ca-activated chloride channel family protein
MELLTLDLARPWALMLAPLPLAAWYWLPALRAEAVVPVPAGVRELLLKLSSAGNGGNRRRTRTMALCIIGWLALIIAIAGPFTEGASLQTPTGRDVIVALDLSSSMDEQDMMLEGKVVARYDAVRQIIGSFLAKRKGDRIGLIAFGHEAFLIAPLSFDTPAIAATLDELTIGLPGHRTDLGRAVGLTVQVLRKEPAGERVLIMLSDGEDNSGALTGTDAARLAAANGVRIYTIGFTSSLDSDGAGVLRQIAELTGGKFFAANSTEALAEISAALDELEPLAADSRPIHLVKDWAAIPVTVAMLALAGLFVQGMRE